LRLIWKVRLSPRFVTSCGLNRSIRAPFSRISPAVGFMVLAMQLKAVVLPAPFGPMSAVMEPRSTVNVH
jgi:hypothetical protein